MDPNVVREQLALQMRSTMEVWFPTYPISFVDAVSGAAIQSLDVPADEKCVRWETWGHSRVDGAHVLEPESSTRPCHFIVKEIVDCTVVSVPKTCRGGQRFCRLVLRLHSHDTRLLNCHRGTKLPANPR